MVIDSWTKKRQDFPLALRFSPMLEDEKRTLGKPRLIFRVCDTYCLSSFFPRTPRTAGSQAYTQYQWTSPGCKPSSPFIATEKKKEVLIEANKPRPGTAEAEIEGRIINVLKDFKVMPKSSTNKIR